MWNKIDTGKYEGMIAETVTVPGVHGEEIPAYFTRPLRRDFYPGIILVPHMPGWDELNREVARRFSQHGYAVLCPDIFRRFGTGLPADVAAKAKAAGGVSDDEVISDCESAMHFLNTKPYSNGKVGIIGMCSGGRHAFLAGCRVKGLNAVVDCWGGRVVASKSELTPAQPVAPIDLTGKLKCPLLGIFGNDDANVPPEHVNQLEEALIAHGKKYEFYRYDGAGHAFWSYDREVYRPKQAMDSWNKVFAFFETYLRGQG